jgi:hypothetical protein
VLLLAYYVVPLLAYHVERKLAFSADINVAPTALPHKPLKKPRKSQPVTGPSRSEVQPHIRLSTIRNSSLV